MCNDNPAKNPRKIERTEYVMPKGKSNAPPIDPNETKSAKFVRIANIRVVAALAAIEHLGKLGNPAYERSPEQIAMLASVLNDATAAMVRELSSKAPGAGRAAVL